MASTFRVKGELSLDGSRFQAGLSRAEIAASRFSSTVSRNIASKLAGLFAIGAVTQFSRRTIESADALVIAAKRMGATVEQVQVLGRAAKDAGSELGAVEKAFERINIARAKALGGDTGALAAFKKAGVSAEDLKTMNAANIFQGKFAAFAKAGSVEDVGPVLREILGKGFGELMPVLQQDFADVSDELQRMGGLLSTENAVALKQFKDALELGSQVMLANWAPVLVRSAETLFAVIGKISAGFSWMGIAIEDFIDDLKLLFLNQARAVFSMLPDFMGKRPVSNLEAEIARIVEKTSGKGSTGDRAALAWAETDKKWSTALDAIKAKIAAEANKIGSPAAPTFDLSGPKAAKQSIGKLGSDSLVAVGNFLGHGAANSMQRIAEQQLDTQRRIASLLEHYLTLPYSSNSDFGGNGA